MARGCLVGAAGRVLGLALASALLAACPQDPEPACGELDKVFVWVDLDGDGFGTEPVGWVCEAAPDEATNDSDCDDADPTVRPAGEEVCDLLDNDCDGSIDETVAKTPWYPDADGDGFGADVPDFACKQPTASHLESPGDCDDANAAVSPLALEVCNGIDDDCDTLTDDADGGVDPTTKSSWYRDADLDGYGNPAFHEERCAGPGGSVLDGTDCDDSDPAVNPAIVEICNDIDDDCDALVDDADTYVDPTTQTEYFADDDVDGFGDATQLVLACDPSNGAIDNDLDCDDSDPLVTIPTNWYNDLDGDAYGAGVVLSYGCFPPNPDAASGVFGLDCNDGSAAVNPGATEVCGDGVDNDCSGSDLSCGPIGAYYVEDGPAWGGDPPVYSCIEACATIFGGVATDYHCSTTQAVQNNMAYLSGYADAFYCTGAGRPDDFQLEPAGNPGYNCGGFGCAYSAYVQDNCFGSRNWCWAN
jgi:hypothetical protein